MESFIPDIKLSNEDYIEIYRAMGYGNNIPEPDIVLRIKEIVNSLQQIITPKCCYSVLNVKKTDLYKWQLKGNEMVYNFHVGKIIDSYLDGVEQFAVFIISVGPEISEFITRSGDEGDLLGQFIADSAGSVIAELCVKAVGKELQKRGLKHTMPYSPGYCGWSISEQKELFRIFGVNPIGVSLNDSFLMIPEKSVSGIYGIGSMVEQQEYGCAICNNISCYKRRQE